MLFANRNTEYGEFPMQAMLSPIPLDEAIEELTPIPPGVLSTGTRIGSNRTETAHIRKEILKLQAMREGTQQKGGKLENLSGVASSRTDMGGSTPSEKSTDVNNEGDDSESDVEGDCMNEDVMGAYRAANAPPTKRRVIAEKVLQPLPDHMEPFRDWIRE